MALDIQVDSVLAQTSRRGPFYTWIHDGLRFWGQTKVKQLNTGEDLVAFLKVDLNVRMK